MARPGVRGPDVPGEAERLVRRPLVFVLRPADRRLHAGVVRPGAVHREGVVPIGMAGEVEPAGGGAEDLGAVVGGDVSDLLVDEMAPRPQHRHRHAEQQRQGRQEVEQPVLRGSD